MANEPANETDRNVPCSFAHKQPPSPHDFPRAVVAGEIPANKRIKAACRRHLHDLERSDVYFDDDEWEAYAQLVSQLEIVDGHELTGNQMEVLPWQSWVVGSILCWRISETRGRRFKSSFLEMSRGSGKTTLMATMLLHVASYNAGAECVVLANTVQQARVAYQAATDFARAAFGDHNNPDEADEALWECTVREMRCRESRGVIRPYAAKNSTLDGLKSFAYLVDEAAEQTTDWMKKIVSATPKKRDCFMVSMTTPGGLENGGRDSPYYVRRRVAVDALKRKNWDKIDTFAALFGLDDDDDMLDESTWIKAQPSLGHVIGYDGYRRLLTEYQSQGKLSDWERFCMCRFSTRDMHWISGDLWEENCGEVPEWPPAEAKVWCALDFSKSFDLSSLAFGWYDGDTFLVRWRHWAIRKEKSDIRRDYQRHLEQWETLDHVEVSDNSVHYDRIQSFLLDLKSRCKLQPIGYDALGGMNLDVQDWHAELPMEPFPQTVVAMGPSTHLFEEMIRNRRIRMMACPITLYALSCVKIESNVNGDRRVTKGGSRGIVDPIVAGIMLAGVLLRDNAERPGAYSDLEDIAF